MNRIPLDVMFLLILLLLFILAVFFVPIFAPKMFLILIICVVARGIIRKLTSHSYVD